MQELIQFPLEYGYTIGLISPTIIWFILFFKYPKERKELLCTSFLLAIASPITAYLWWTKDWWHPLTLTGTSVGFEDVWLGWVTGSIAVLYEVVHKYKHHIHNKDKKMRERNAHVVVLVVFLLIYSMVRFLSLTSYWATIIALSLGTLFILYQRKDLLKDAVENALLVVIWSLGCYIPIILFVPNWIKQTYDWHFLSGHLIGGIPIEELTFWLLAGAFFGLLYKYWRKERIF